MDTKRLILYAALAFVVYSLWDHWQKDYPNPVVYENGGSPVAQSSNDHLLPVVNSDDINPEKAVVSKGVDAQKNSKTISVKTDVLHVTIDLKQGDIIGASLLNYPESTENKTPFSLLHDQSGKRYVANSSLFVVKNQAVDNVNFNFTTEQSSYELSDQADKLVVRLHGKNQNGLKAVKEFEFTKGRYLMEVRYLLSNEGVSVWKGYMNTQLLQTSPKDDQSSLFHIGSYTGASYSNPGHHRYQKVSFKDMAKSNLDVETEGGWVAMQQHYFLSAWIPYENSKNRFYTRAVNDNFTIGAVSKPVSLAPSETVTLGTRLYLGPEITSVLKSIAPGLDMTVDYGWLWFLSSLLFSLMKAIYSVVGNWGWSIVLVTVVIKLAFYRLSATSYKSMAAMRQLQPKLQALRERYGDDKAKMSQATMELYRQEKVNPLGGCLPIIVQIPVFIALYWVLLESVELRQAPFILWINDLAAADPYHILPIIMGGTMLIQQKLNPAPPDPMQAKIMMFLPVLFTALFWNFPAGLVLYWIVNNSLSILQQWYITRKYSGDSKAPKKLAVVK